MPEIVGLSPGQVLLDSLFQNQKGNSPNLCWSSEVNIEVNLLAMIGQVLVMSLGVKWLVLV